jgi:hypothetical protein
MTPQTLSIDQAYILTSSILCVLAADRSTGPFYLRPGMVVQVVNLQADPLIEVEWASTRVKIFAEDLRAKSVAIAVEKGTAAVA